MENIKHLSTWKTQVHLEAAAPLTSLFYICFVGCLWQVPSDGGVRSHPLPLLTDCWAGKPTPQWGRMHKRVTRARYHFGSRPIIFKQKQKDILDVKKCDFSFSSFSSLSKSAYLKKAHCFNAIQKQQISWDHWSIKGNSYRDQKKIIFHFSCHFYNLLLILLCKQIQVQSHFKKSFRAKAYSLAQAIQPAWQCTVDWLQLLRHLLQQNTSDTCRQHTTHICPGTALCMREVSCPPIPTCLTVLVSS